MKYSFAADHKLVESFEKQSQRVVFSTGYTLFRQGDPPKGLYILRGGEASLAMRSETGKVLISFEVPAGSLLGLPALIGKEPYTFSAEARPGADVSFVAQKDFEELLQSEAALYPKVLKILAAEVRSLRLAIPHLLEKPDTPAYRGLMLQ